MKEDEESHKSQVQEVPSPTKPPHGVEMLLEVLCHNEGRDPVIELRGRRVIGDMLTPYPFELMVLLAALIVEWSVAENITMTKERFRLWIDVEQQAWMQNDSRPPVAIPFNDASDIAMIADRAFRLGRFTFAESQVPSPNSPKSNEVAS